MSQSQPPEALYIRQARRAVTAEHLKMKAYDDEQAARRHCAVEMHKVGVSSFSFTSHGKPFKAALVRPMGEKVCIRKLYTLLQAGEMTLDQFFDCVTADVTAVEETVGPTLKERVTDKVKLALDLVIRPVEATSSQ